MQPNILRWCTASFFPCHASNGVMPSTLFVGHLFSTYTAVLTTLLAKPARQPLRFEHAPGCGHHSPIPAFDQAVLLRTVGRGVLPMNPVRHAVLRELEQGEFTPSISSEYLQLDSRLAFCPRLDLLDGSRSTIL